MSMFLKMTTKAEMRPTIPAVGQHRGPFAEFRLRFRRNRLAVAGLAVVFIYIGVAILADVLCSYDFITSNQISNAFAPVGSAAGVEWDGKELTHLYICGADNFGRDVLGRIVHGARVSMIIGFTTILFAVAVGGGLGAEIGRAHV